jgi:hypothetical protein
VAAEEMIFWKDLLDLVEAEGQSVVFYNMDASKESQVADLRAHPAIKQWANSLDDVSLHEDSLIFIRLEHSPGVQDIRHLREMDAYYLLNSPSIAGRDTTRHKSELLGKLLGGANGMLIIDEAAGRTLPRIIKWIELVALNAWANRLTDKEDS